jgi:hypothetical protein
MNAANDNWPLVLTRQQAADMCNICVSTLDRWVAQQILPGPISGTRRWSRDAIVRAVSGDGASITSHDDASPFDEWKRTHAH